MANAIFKVFFKIIKGIANLFLAPINALIVNFFPDFSSMISTFNNAVNRVIGGGLGFFAHLLPPTTRQIILIWFGILIAYYTLSFTAHIILKIIDIIKRVKVW